MLQNICPRQELILAFRFKFRYKKGSRDKISKWEKSLQQQNDKTVKLPIFCNQFYCWDVCRCDKENVFV